MNLHKTLYRIFIFGRDIVLVFFSPKIQSGTIKTVADTGTRSQSHCGATAQMQRHLEFISKTRQAKVSRSNYFGSKKKKKGKEQLF